MSLRPSTQDIALAIDSQLFFKPDEFFFVYRMYDAFAGAMVWTYTEPSDDPKVHDEVKVIARITWLSHRKVRSLIPAVSQYFIIGDGFWRPKHLEWIRIARPARDPLAETTREIARLRSDDRCVYCGTHDGPFHHDHLFPRSRGGTDDPSNIVLACEPCNKSKRNMTLMEWVASLLPEDRRQQNGSP